MQAFINPNNPLYMYTAKVVLNGSPKQYLCSSCVPSELCYWSTRETFLHQERSSNLMGIMHMRQTRRRREYLLWELVLDLATELPGNHQFCDIYCTSVSVVQWAATQYTLTESEYKLSNRKEIQLYLCFIVNQQCTCAPRYKLSHQPSKYYAHQNLCINKGKWNAET